MVAVPGSEFLSSILHVVSQSLLIPVIVGLLAFMIYAIVAFGGLLSEYSSRIRLSTEEIETIINDLSRSRSSEELIKTVQSSTLSDPQKEIVVKIASNPDMGSKSREAFARKLLEAEELKAARSLEKTDMVTRLGPTLGLMGTLIPMGPGLAALGAGDVNTLAQAIIIAFDTTVVGIGAGGVAYVISKVRRRWYEEYLSNLEAVAESVLEVLESVKTKTPYPSGQ
ncbi:MotA/TolQ/ExbB proton channel family protein [Methanobacterium congolense]|jgi:Biopolymer transport proteins|uniref:Biopolymer transport protein n=1 Tax=Methanobacterium congolense TaxID=118062 RepID=A0A1D3L3Z8_9EURY|nr:MotA/TolQ/ExbB proton channel family protein [Methanobacterium congolense]SCG86372.1 Biopolymer transport protein [Methanobacterium congolense]